PIQRAFSEAGKVQKAPVRKRHGLTYCGLLLVFDCLLKTRKVLFADNLNKVMQMSRSLNQPAQRLLTNPVLLGISGLYMSFIKSIEPSVVSMLIPRPSLDKPSVAIFRQSPQKFQVV